MEKKNYRELNIHQRINYKSGWEIAVAYEGAKMKNGKRYCRMTEIFNTKDSLLPLNCCSQDYNNQAKHRFFNGGRAKLSFCYIFR